MSDFENINKLSIVQPVRPVVKWISGKYTDDDIRYNDYSFMCSNCGCIEDKISNFCPNCGADMRGN